MTLYTYELTHKVDLLFCLYYGKSSFDTNVTKTYISSNILQLSECRNGKVTLTRGVATSTYNTSSASLQLLHRFAASAAIKCNHPMEQKPLATEAFYAL